MRKVNVDDMWKEPIGTVVVDDENCMYVYLGRTEYDRTVMLYSMEDSDTLHEDELETEEFIVMDVALRLDVAVKAKLAEVLRLLDDGWREGNKTLDLSDTLVELKTLIKIKSIADTI